MTQSETIGALAAALSKAQGQITGALKDSENPFFKSKYADLASVWDACRASLSTNGLAVIQTTDGGLEGVTIITTLSHSSGEWIKGSLTVRPVKNDPQGLGSAVTYARRYALAAMVGVAQIDDDANAASGKDAGSTAWIDGAAKGKKTPAPTPEPAPKKDPISAWKGPLGKSDLTKKLRALTADIALCEDMSTLDGVLSGYQAVIEQLKIDIPEWWQGEASDGFQPLADRIEDRKAHLSQPNKMMAG